MNCFPFMIPVEGKRCLLVGGGKVAARKVEKLLPFGVEIVLCAREVCPELTALGVDAQEKEYSADLLEGICFAVAATDDPVLNARVAADCRQKGIPVNSVDDKDNCDFYFPALIHQGPVTIGITTGGVSPALAGALREYLESVLPENLEELTQKAGVLRGTMSSQEYTKQVKQWLKQSVAEKEKG